MLRFHIVIIKNNFAYIDLTLFSDFWGVLRKNIGLIFMLFFTYFQILVTFILNIRMKYGGVKVEITEKCDFYAILNGKLLEVVTQNLKSFSNHNR